LKKIGITGGIGSGKSIICRVFKVLGVPVYDADSRAKLLTVNDPEIIQGMKEIFGEDVYQNGELNRKMVAEKVFPQPDLLARVNALIHPAVGRDFKNWLENQKAPYVLKEAALIFESGSHAELDGVITVSAPAELRITRVLVRDSHRTRQDIKDIISRQMDDNARSEAADFEIINDDTQLVIPQVLRLHETFLDH
jgi:dephospho-CoA kinase